MKIAKDSVVTLRYKITDPAGKLLQQSDEPVAYLHGGYGNILEKVEAALEGQDKGYETVLALPAEDAFGQRDESLARTISKKEFPPGIKVGGRLRGHDDNGMPQVYTVMKIKGDTVFLDGNHPLAGQDIRFALKVTDVREATAGEIEHGHAHGAHGHHH